MLFPFKVHSPICKGAAGEGGGGGVVVLAVGPRVQLGESRGLPEDCPSISPTSWVNKSSLLPVDLSAFPAQTPRLCQFSLGNSGLNPKRNRVISSAYPLPVTLSEPQSLSTMGATLAWKRGPPPTATPPCKVLRFQYSWLLDGCHFQKFCMFMKCDYST